jgi:hypothetical protein
MKDKIHDLLSIVDPVLFILLALVQRINYYEDLIERFHQAEEVVLVLIEGWDPYIPIVCMIEVEKVLWYLFFPPTELFDER